MNYEAATINSSKEEIREIFENTKTIAIVGLSPDPSKASNMVGAYLKNAGFKIVPVYPIGDEILGEKVYKSLADIPFKIDMVDVFRKAEVIDIVVDDCIKRGDIDCVWTQLGLVNNAAALKAQNAGIKVVQDYCTKIEYSYL